MDISRRLDADSRNPVRDGFYMPAEWAPHARTWMCWPARVAPFGGPEGLLRAKLAYAEVARAVARFEPVAMAVRPQDVAEARLALGPGISSIELPIDDGWARDTGPTFVVDGKGGLAGVQWRFNAWGNKYQPHAQDAAFASRVLEWGGHPVYAAPLVCEGGAINVDGAGTLLTTEQCLMNENRNPELTRQQVEERLALYCGALRVIWLGEGFSDVETDGHVDAIACFAPGCRVLVGVHDDRRHPDYAPALEAVRRLHAARDANGRAFEIVEVKQAALGHRHDGSVLERSYINFYVCNGAVIAPVFDDPNDAAAQATLASCFPGREIVPVPAHAIVEGGGGIHCITQQEPRP